MFQTAVNQTDPVPESDWIYSSNTLTHMNHTQCLLNSVCCYWKHRKTQAKRKTKCAPGLNWFLAMRFPIIQDMCVRFTVEYVSFAFLRSVKNLADTFQLISRSENNRLKVHPETIQTCTVNLCLCKCASSPQWGPVSRESLYQLYPEFPGDSFDNQGWSTVIASPVCSGFQTVRLISHC